ncbi:MAG: hypothetical protein ACFFDN_43045 [Candidatus Hodarchaeota archaeon]
MSKKINRIIIKNLNRLNARYLTPENKYYLIVPHRSLKIGKDYVKIKFSKKKGIKAIRLNYPFRINKTVAYIFGLVLGSAVKRKDRLILNVDPRQVPKIINFCKQLNVSPKYKIINKRRKKRNKNYYNRYFQNAIVHLPSPVYQYLQALGLNLFHSRIPSYFPPKFRHFVISGYLNSKKTSLIHHSTTPLNQSVLISAKSKPYKKDYAKKFIRQIYKDLKYHSIRATIENRKFHSIIRIKSRSIARLIKKFHIRRPQIRYSGKFISLLKKYPHLLRTINLYGLNSFQLSVLEIAFYHFFKRNCREIEYTRFEKMFSCSSNKIRKCLYEFQETGLIQYFAKGKKEFLKPTFLCFKYAKDLIEDKLSSLKGRSNSKGEYIFICKDCGRGVDYISAMEGGFFSCPDCQSTKLEQYSEKKLKRSMNSHHGQLTQFNKSLEVMCCA